jgi:hypothetical protein
VILFLRGDPDFCVRFCSLFASQTDWRFFWNARIGTIASAGKMKFHEEIGETSCAPDFYFVLRGGFRQTVGLFFYLNRGD